MSSRGCKVRGGDRRDAVCVLIMCNMPFARCSITASCTLPPPGRRPCRPFRPTHPAPAPHLVCDAGKQVVLPAALATQHGDKGGSEEVQDDAGVLEEAEGGQKRERGRRRRGLQAMKRWVWVGCLWASWSKRMAATQWGYAGALRSPSVARWGPPSTRLLQSRVWRALRTTNPARSQLCINTSYSNFGLRCCRCRT